MVFNQIENDVHVHLRLEVLLEVDDEGGFVVGLLHIDNTEYCPKHKWTTENEVIKSDVVTFTLIKELGIT